MPKSFSFPSGPSATELLFGKEDPFFPMPVLPRYKTWMEIESSKNVNKILKEQIECKHI